MDVDSTMGSPSVVLIIWPLDLSFAFGFGSGMFGCCNLQQAKTRREHKILKVDSYRRNSTESTYSLRRNVMIVLNFKKDRRQRNQYEFLRRQSLHVEQLSIGGRHAVAAAFSFNIQPTLDKVVRSEVSKGSSPSWMFVFLSNNKI